MENYLIFDITGFTLMFMLGLRHGLDPDHIAIIDNMVIRIHDQRPSLARWVGTLFAIGHGLVVTCIAVLVSLLSTKFSIPQNISVILEWVPVLLLLLVGTLNLVQLLKGNYVSPQGWRSHFIPQKLRDGTSALSVLLVGVLFATVFDTATQAAAWGYAASVNHGVWGALVIGLIFSAGMIITDTIDSNIVCGILARATDATTIKTYRTFLGWFIVAMSFGVAGYAILSAFNSSFELSDDQKSILGVIFMLLALMMYFVLLLRKSFKSYASIGSL
ncbi:MAG: nickel permease [Gammaproteobacteria bacterium]|nr:nickel permease [Gammaproteobacteria bacterium]